MDFKKLIDATPPSPLPDRTVRYVALTIYRHLKKQHVSLRDIVAVTTRILSLAIEDSRKEQADQPARSEADTGT